MASDAQRPMAAAIEKPSVEGSCMNVDILVVRSFVRS